MTKFRLIKELYQGEGGQDSLKEYFDILESKELLADTEELLQDAAHFFHKRENYKAASYFFSRLVGAKKAANEQLRIMKKERGSFGFIVLFMISLFSADQNRVHALY